MADEASLRALRERLVEQQRFLVDALAADEGAGIPDVGLLRIVSFLEAATQAIERLERLEQEAADAEG